MARNTRRRGTRRGGRGIFGTVWRPVHHGLMAGDSVVSAVTNTARNIVSTGIRGVDRAGTSIVGHANNALSFKRSRKNRNASRRANRNNRKNRNTRRNRRN